MRHLSDPEPWDLHAAPLDSRTDWPLYPHTIGVCCNKYHRASVLAQIRLGSSKHMAPVSYPHNIITYR